MTPQHVSCNPSDHFHPQRSVGQYTVRLVAQILSCMLLRLGTRSTSGEDPRRQCMCRTRPNAFRNARVTKLVRSCLSFVPSTTKSWKQFLIDHSSCPSSSSHPAWSPQRLLNLPARRHRDGQLVPYTSALLLSSAPTLTRSTCAYTPGQSLTRRLVSSLSSPGSFTPPC